MFDRARLISELETTDEGYREYVYDDKNGVPLRPGITLQGNATLGIGWNVSSRGVTREQARIICGWHLDEAWHDLKAVLPWVEQLDEARAGALTNMAFQLGVPRLLQFHNALSLLESKRYDESADAFLQSLWAKQVPSRAERITKVIRTGKDENVPTETV